MTTWATVDDVQSLTGKTVDDAAVDMAAGIIEVTSAIGNAAATPGVILSKRNADWLRRAVAYQTAFMVEYPDFFSRMDVNTFTQDGASASIKADGLVLAPMARRCIKRLSWTGVRTIRSSELGYRGPNRSRFGDQWSGGIDDFAGAPYTSQVTDDLLPWRPL